MSFHTHTQKKKSQDISFSEKLVLHKYVVTTSLKANAFSSEHLKSSLASNTYYLSKLLLYNRYNIVVDEVNLFTR